MRWFVGGLILIGAVLAGAWIVRLPADRTAAHDDEHEHSAEVSGQSVQLSEQAVKNLGLRAAAATPSTYWKSISVPGVVIDRPGVSDRGVVSPVAGIVSRIHAYPGENVKPGATLFTIRLVSESLNLSQLELFKVAQDIQINREQKERLLRASESGSLAGSRIIEIENQLRRLETTLAAYRQDLQLRGLSTQMIDQAESGKFLKEFEVLAPQASAADQAAEFSLTSFRGANGSDDFSFQLQSLEIRLGQQIQAGEVLCYLADHRSLLIEGRAFTDDLPTIQMAALNRAPIEAAFDKADRLGWSALDPLQIQHVANTIDSDTRTFGFYMPLQNEWRTYTHDNRARQLWRFRPGDRVKLRVPTEKMDNVIVVPADAVAKVGADAYVFRQSGTRFDRLPVHTVAEDREHVVLANDGSVPAGVYLVQSGASSLNRILKSKSGGAEETKMHVHADGSVHAAH